MGRGNLRLIVAALLVALLLAVAYVQFVPSASVGELAVDPPTLADAPAAIAVARSEAELQSAVQEDAGDARTAVAEVAESPIPDSLAPGFARGTVVVSNYEGRPRGGLDGELHLQAGLDSSVEPQRVPIVAGRFEVALEPGKGRVVVGGVVEGRAVAVFAETARLQAREEPYRLRMAWYEPLLLEVCDSETGQHLDGVEVWTTDRFEHGPRIPSAALGRGRADSSPLLGPLTSPIEFEAWPPGVDRDGVELRVVAPGYAWAALRADPFFGGTRRIDLTPAATLEVHFTGDPLPHVPREQGRFGTMRVRLIVGRAADLNTDGLPNEALAVPEVFNTEPILLPGLPRESLTLTLAVGEAWFLATTTLAQATIDLAAAPPHRVEIHLAATDEPLWTPIAGAAHFPEGFTARPSVEVLPLGNGKSERGLGESLVVFHQRRLGDAGESRSDFRFRTNSPTTGPHAFLLGDAGYAIVLDIPAGGDTNLSLTLPPPAEVTVRAMNLGPGGAPKGSAVRYSWVPPDDPSIPRRYARASLDPETASATIHPPPGRVEFTLEVPGRIGERAVLDLTSGYRTELQLRASPQAHLLLTLRDGDTRIPAPNLSFAHFEDAQGTRAPAAARAHSGGVLYTLPPGDYRLTIPDPPSGYLPIEPIDAHLLAEQTTELTVELRRAP